MSLIKEYENNRIQLRRTAPNATPAKVGVGTSVDDPAFTELDLIRLDMQALKLALWECNRGLNTLMGKNVYAQTAKARQKIDDLSGNRYVFSGVFSTDGNWTARVTVVWQGVLFKQIITPPFNTELEALQSAIEIIETPEGTKFPSGTIVELI